MYTSFVYETFVDTCVQITYPTQSAVWSAFQKCLNAAGMFALYHLAPNSLMLHSATCAAVSLTPVCTRENMLSYIAYAKVEITLLANYVRQLSGPKFSPKEY